MKQEPRSWTWNKARASYNDEMHEAGWLDLREANLCGVILSGVDLHRTDLRHASLTGANLCTAILNNAELDEAKLNGVNFSGADLSMAKFNKATLDWAILSGAFLYGADLSSASLVGTNLSGVNLRDSKLNWANLNRANLSGTDLTGAGLVGVKYGNAAMTRIPVQLHGLRYDVLILDQHIMVGCELHSTEEWKSFDDERIRAMGDFALDFYYVHKDAILALAHDHQCMIPQSQPEGEDH